MSGENGTINSISCHAIYVWASKYTPQDIHLKDVNSVWRNHKNLSVFEAAYLRYANVKLKPRKSKYKNVLEILNPYAFT